MPDDLFESSEQVRRRSYERLARLRESPEYGSALEVWRAKMLESFEQWLSPTLLPEDAERLRQRAIGTTQAISAIDEALETTRSWTEQIKAALHERDDARALEMAMSEHAAEQAAFAMGQE